MFLSANLDDVKAALENGTAAGRVLNKHYIEDDEYDKELRIAFDFDGVLASDESEKVYKATGGNMKEYFNHEQQHASEALELGPIGPLLQRISFFQKMEKKKADSDSSYKRILKTAIITARNAPAHERVVSSLKSWGVEVDDAFFLGGIEKARILKIMKPHIFFDDQMTHLEHMIILQGSIFHLELPINKITKNSMAYEDKYKEFERYLAHGGPEVEERTRNLSMAI